jgi:hypothetical protein
MFFFVIKMKQFNISSLIVIMLRSFGELLITIFGLRSLQFFRVGETPILFVYFEISHYHSSST